MNWRIWFQPDRILPDTGLHWVPVQNSLQVLIAQMQKITE